MQIIASETLQKIPEVNYFHTSTHVSRLEHSPVWVEIIKSFTDGLDYSYARIAQRIHVSRSALQKLIKNPERRPRDEIFYALCCYYYKIFYSPQRSEKAAKYIEENRDQVLYQIIMELKDREMIEEEPITKNTHSSTNPIESAHNFFQKLLRRESRIANHLLTQNFGYQY